MYMSRIMDLAELFVNKRLMYETPLMRVNYS